MTTAVEGAVIGEIPELNRKFENQYNSERSEYEVLFEAEDKSTENQNVTSIELLGTNMTGAELKVSGFFGGKESLEAAVLLKDDGKIEICTEAASACP